VREEQVQARRLVRGDLVQIGGTIFKLGDPPVAGGWSTAPDRVVREDRRDPAG
jgi:hypothetical protein